MNEWKVFRAAVLEEVKEWQALLDRHDDPGVFFSPGYLYLWEMFGAGQAYCLYVDSEAGAMIYPFLRRSIPSSPQCDLTSAYGLGGPRHLSPPSSIQEEQRRLNAFRSAISEYCKQSGVISEFARLHPDAIAAHLYREKRGNAVWVDLTHSFEEIWADHSPACRRKINRAKRNGFVVKIAEDASLFGDFYPIYIETMQRRQADCFYFFPIFFFDHLHQWLKGHFLYAIAYDGRFPVSAELCLRDSHQMTSFLGGTASKHLHQTPNPLLKHALITWGKERGLSSFYLGGGSRPGDGIFQYKRSFSRKGIQDFSIGWYIWDLEAYHDLCRNINVDPRNVSFFPAYRCKEPRKS